MPYIKHAPKAKRPECCKGATLGPEGLNTVSMYITIIQSLQSKKLVRGEEGKLINTATRVMITGKVLQPYTILSLAGQTLYLIVPLGRSD